MKPRSMVPMSASVEVRSRSTFSDVLTIKQIKEKLKKIFEMVILFAGNNYEFDKNPPNYMKNFKLAYRAL